MTHSPVQEHVLIKVSGPEDGISQVWSFQLFVVYDFRADCKFALKRVA